MLFLVVIGLFLILLGGLASADTGPFGTHGIPREEERQ